MSLVLFLKFEMERYRWKENTFKLSLAQSAGAVEYTDSFSSES